MWVHRMLVLLKSIVLLTWGGITSPLWACLFKLMWYYLYCSLACFCSVYVCLLFSSGIGFHHTQALPTFLVYLCSEHTDTQVWRSEDSLRGLILSFHPVSPGD